MVSHLHERQLPPEGPSVDQAAFPSLCCPLGGDHRLLVLKYQFEIELEVGVDPECLVKSGLGESVVLRGSGDVLRPVQRALSSQLTLGLSF